jgi:biotin carboxyl carrier protein
MEVVLGAAASFALEGGSLPRDRTVDVWASGPWRQARRQIPVDFTIDGRSFDVALSKSGDAADQWRAQVRSGDQLLLDSEVRLATRRARGSAIKGPEGVVEVGTGGRVEGGGSELRTVANNGAIEVTYKGRTYFAWQKPALSTADIGRTARFEDKNTLESPMPGKVLKVMVREAEEVEEDQPLVIVEAMKMEFTVRAPHGGRVASVKHAEGDQVAVGDVLVELA